MRTAEELRADRAGADADTSSAAKGHPWPFASATEMLAMGAASGLSIAAMKRAKETVTHGDALEC